MIWVTEPGVFAKDSLRDYLRSSVDVKHLDWRDAWSVTGHLPKTEDKVMFHGSLGLASELATTDTVWKPGAFCSPDFRCSYWHSKLREFTLNSNPKWMPASELVSFQSTEDRIFVRPDSHLKPFSGRVLTRENWNLKGIDYGFYFENPDEIILVSPVKEILAEYRFVVGFGNEVWTGSRFEANGRTGTERVTKASDKEAWQFAAQVAVAWSRPADPVYVLDVAMTNDGPKLVELNPFSGADLYECDPEIIVQGFEKNF